MRTRQYEMTLNIQSSTWSKATVGVSARGTRRGHVMRWSTSLWGTRPSHLSLAHSLVGVGARGTRRGRGMRWSTSLWGTWP